MPLIVQLVIMLVNGNLGAGVAVMGAFSLVRFRSIPGTAKDIGSIFCAMAVGLATGMGYLAAALVFLVCFSIVNVILNMSKFGERNQGEKQLKLPYRRIWIIWGFLTIYLKNIPRVIS